MTVIATDGKSMAGDGLTMLYDRIISHDTVKVFRLKNRSLFGFSGETCDGIILAGWIDSGKTGDCPELHSIDALVLNQDGTIDLYEAHNKGRCERVKAPIAIGAGMGEAMGALDAGALPKRAVEIAIGRSGVCGGKVTDIAL